MRKRRDAPSNPLFKNLKLLKFNDICKVNLAAFVFKTLNNLITHSIQFNARFIGPYNLRNIPPLEIPFVRDRQSQMFIPVRGALLWNNIPENIRSARSLFTFKKNIKSYYMSEYNQI